MWMGMGSKKSEHCADVICTCRQGYVGLGQRSPTLFIRESRLHGWMGDLWKIFDSVYSILEAVDTLSCEVL